MPRHCANSRAWIYVIGVFNAFGRGSFTANLGSIVVACARSDPAHKWYSRHLADGGPQATAHAHVSNFAGSGDFVVGSCAASSKRG